MNSVDPSISNTLGMIIISGLLLAGIRAEYRTKHRLALGLLTCAALMMRLLATTMDPFLNYWDEVFHAAVARNLIDHPFTPMLYTEPAMPVTENWSRMHIWLHKPPFFLWQIALSLWTFGPEPWAVRIPSALWTTALVPVTYRLARLLTHELPSATSRAVAFGAALFTAFNSYLQELVAGAISTDHNDAIFFSLVAVSWWAYWEHRSKHSFHWALLAGLASAAAVLCKWYFGLIVFLPWTLEVVMDRSRSAIKAYLGAVAMVLILAGSWLLYIHLRFPAETAYERWFKAMHFQVAVDGHEGGPTYHLTVIGTYLAPLTWWVVAIALLVILALVRAPSVRHFLVLTIVPTHVFFALAATKMVSYTLFLLPLYLIAIAAGITWSLARVRLARPILILPMVACTGLAVLLWQPWTTSARHPRVGTVGIDAHRAQQFAVLEQEPRLANLMPVGTPTVLFNVPFVYDVQFMFRNGIQCMRGIPDGAVIERLRAKGYRVFVLQDGVDLTNIPAGVELITDSMFSYPRIARL